MNTFASFNSRSEALRLAKVLSEKGFAVTVINTPRRQGLSCGLSVLFNNSISDIALEIIDKLKLRSFYGIYDR